MGAFNVVTSEVTCPGCRRSVAVRAQFKYGHTWQVDYKVGDDIRWGGNQMGRHIAGRVVVDAVAETACPTCGFGGDDRDWDLYVIVHQGRIVEVRNANGEYDFFAAGSSFIEDSE